MTLEDRTGGSLKVGPGGNLILVLEDGPGRSLKFGPGGNLILDLENYCVGPEGWTWSKFKMWTCRKSYFIISSHSLYDLAATGT